jgi:hypothetical protein
MLSTADVCVNPDRPSETNDISTMTNILEYMALGKPIVQFDLKEGRFSAQQASSYFLRYLWEKYSEWSKGQLPPAFNRRHSYWKKTRYSNEKLKKRLGWVPRVPTVDGLQRY